MNSPIEIYYLLDDGFFFLSFFFKWMESWVRGAALLEEFKLWAYLLPAQKCKFPCLNN